MAEYKLTPAFLALIRKRSMVSGLPLALLAVAVGIFIGGRGDLSPQLLMISLPIVALSLGWGFFRGLRQQKKGAESYRLFIEGDEIRRTQEGLPEVRISRSEVSKIHEAAGRGMTVQAVSPDRRISIPVALQDYDEVRSELADWRDFQEISSARAKWNSFASPAAGIITIAAFYVTFTAANPLVVETVGSLFGIAMLVCLVVIQRSKDIPVKLKRNMWLMLLPLLSIGMKVWLAFTGR